MTDLDRLTAWIDGYARAWNSNDPEHIGALFADDAGYYTAPFREPWRGREEIVQGWIGAGDKPGETSFEWHPLVVTDALCVVQGTTTYPTATYSNLWLIRLAPDGRAREFTEWWMAHPS
jgi:uncharacterized protein (TIGR02246 family)